MSPLILAANWKMNLGLEQSQVLAREFVPFATEAISAVWIAAAAPHLSAVVHAVKGSPIQVGAQNVHFADTGAFTGEISVPMLREIGCTFALTGHSECRHQMGESNELVIKRTVGSLKAGFTTILCIGETLAERESTATLAVLAEQLEPVLSGISSEQIKRLVIAYEPVWAIGTGKVAELPQIEEAHSYIASLVEKHHAGCTAPILYGGSVTPDNFAGIASINTVNGALVGGASLSAAKFADLVQIANAFSL